MWIEIEEVKEDKTETNAQNEDCCSRDDKKKNCC